MTYETNGFLVTQPFTTFGEMVNLITDTTIPADTGIDVIVKQDTNSDGTAENEQTISLSGGAGEENNLTGFESQDGSDLWARIELSSSDPSATPEVNSVSVEADIGRGARVQVDLLNARFNRVQPRQLQWDEQADWENPQSVDEVRADNGILSLEYFQPASGVSRWTFDDRDTENGTALDIWGNNDGAINGATTGQSGANQTYDTREAYQFSGGDLVDTGIGSLSTPFSLSAWIYVDNSNTRKGIFALYGGSSDDWYFEVDGESGNVLDLTDDAQGEVQGNESLNTGQWYMATVTRSDSAVTMYLDDSQDVQDTSFSADTYEDGPLTIGALDSDTVVFEGMIDDPRYYDKELTSTEVSNLYNTGTIDG